MARVLLAWELGGGLGHCVKLAPLATGLVERGHDVYFAARDVATAQRVLRQPDVHFVQAPCVVSRPVPAMRQPRAFSQVLSQVGYHDDQQLQALVDSWRTLLELIEPAAVVCEHAPSALLASRWTDAFRVAIGTGFSVPPDVAPLPDLCPWFGPLSIDLAAHEYGVLRRVNRLLCAGDQPPLDRLAQLFSDVDASFVMTFRELDHHPVRREAAYGGSWTLPGGDTPVWPPGDGPRVFAYLKPVAGPFRVEAVLAVLRELPIRTLAYVPQASPGVLGLQSPSLRICQQPLDAAAVAQQCELAVLNGTSGTATQCLLGGVPLVMVPLFLEQAAFSRRVVELGAGLVCEPNRIELLAGRVWRVLRDDRYRQAARAFADRYADYDPRAAQEQLVDCVDSLLSRGGFEAFSQDRCVSRAAAGRPLIASGVDSCGERESNTLAMPCAAKVQELRSLRGFSNHESTTTRNGEE